MSTKARYHHGDLRTALIEAGEAVLVERGLAGFTLRECARRAGGSHAAPAHHFGSASGLLTVLAARGYAALAEALAAAHVDDATARFAATMRAYVDFARKNPERFRLMFRCDVLDQAAPELIEASRKTFARLTNVIRAQRSERPLAPEELATLPALPELVADVLVGWCQVHGMAHLLIEGQLSVMHPDTSQAFWEAMIDANAPRLAAMLQNDG